MMAGAQRIAFLDVQAGVAGDMLLAALIDAVSGFRGSIVSREASLS